LPKYMGVGPNAGNKKELFFIVRLNWKSGDQKLSLGKKRD